MQERYGESAASWYRAERVFRRNGDWYFRTREGIDVGPYVSQFEAEAEASALTHLLRGVESVDEAHNVIRDFLLDTVGGLIPADHRRRARR